jgi:predicted N-acyltransferase
VTRPSPILEIQDSFSAFSAQEWNELTSGDFVFADHRFLMALEAGGCLGRRTGWKSRILAVRSEGRLVGALPLFEKSNSYGEYIFDWGWANAAFEAGIPYYPKLVAAIPFTPATGPKFLLTEDLRLARQVREILINAVDNETQSRSSMHFLFTTPEESEALAANGYLIRHSFQYHWQNRNWKTFEDFLGSLRSKRRAEIRREREAVASSRLKIERLTGEDLTPRHAEIMYGFYRSTIHKMGGHTYLTPEFFLRVFETMKDSILFVMASTEDSIPVAGAFNFFKGRTLYGRYWGCHDDYRQLHFEVCYYQAIDWAIERGIELFEAGAQGEHKFNRGFTPRLTLSGHSIRDSRLRLAIEGFLEREKTGIQELFREYETHSPFRRISSPLLSEFD